MRFLRRNRVPFTSVASLAFLSIASACLPIPAAVAQESMIDAIRRLDADGDGRIEPSELNDRVRRFLRPIAEARGLRLDRSNSIERFEEAVERYQEYQERRYRSRYSLPQREDGLRDFRPGYEDPLIPEFGSGEVKYRYSRENLRDADRTLWRYDENDDGYLDWDEARRGSWSGGDPFEYDTDGDGRLSRLELAQRDARQRVLDRQPDPQELIGNRFDRLDDRRDEDEEFWTRRSRERSSDGGSSRSSRYLAYNVMDRYDRNRNGRLEENEWVATGIERGDVDANLDGVVSRDELDAWIYRTMDGRANDLSDVLPTWFFDRDLDGDGQISMDEFSEEWDDEIVREFEQLDADGDGFLTVREMLRAKTVVGGSYASDKAEILMPRSIVISEINVEDDVTIGKLKLQLSMTHTYVSHLDAYLIGPGGERVELFTEVGRNDDHFEDTIFDDEADSRITRSRPPFRGSFQPEAVEKKEPGLSRFQGRSTRGVWQLMVRSTRSDRAGILHRWSLLVEPESEPEELPGFVTNGASDGDGDDGQNDDREDNAGSRSDGNGERGRGDYRDRGR